MSRLLGVLKDPLLSVVMPCYNERNTIEEIIRRVLAVPIRTELIVVDDGSKDGTRDILSRLAEGTAGIGAGRVEVAQRNRADAVSALVMRQRAFDGELGLAIGVDRPRRMILGDRRLLGIPEHRCRRREDEMAHAGGDHRIEHRQRTADVVAVVARGSAYRLGHREPGREMHHRVGPVLFDCAAQVVGVEDVALDEHRLAAACPSRRRFVPGREIVVNDDVLAAVDERLYGMAANVAGASGHEDRAHGRPIE